MASPAGFFAETRPDELAAMWLHRFFGVVSPAGFDRDAARQARRYAAETRRDKLAAMWLHRFFEVVSRTGFEPALVLSGPMGIGL